jgi:hypothetical protein
VRQVTNLITRKESYALVRLTLKTVLFVYV